MNSRAAGFSILELLIAVSIISVTVMALGSGQISAFRTSAKSEEVVGARELLLGKISELQQRGFQDLRTSCDAGACDGTSTSGRYTLGWKVDTTTRANGWVVAEVRASWSSGGTTRNYAATQFVSCTDEPPQAADRPFKECDALW